MFTYTWRDHAGRQYSRKAGDTLVEVEAFKRRVDDQLAGDLPAGVDDDDVATYAADWIHTWLLKDRIRARCRGILRAAACLRPGPTLGLTHLQFEAMLTASRESTNPFDFAFVCLLGLLGLRIFETSGRTSTTSPRNTSPGPTASRQGRQGRAGPAAACGQPRVRPRGGRALDRRRSC